MRNATVASRRRTFKNAWCHVIVFGALLWPSLFAATNSLDETYNQWKQALNTNAATAGEHITALPGFSVELLRSAKTNEGSWVAMTFDPRGRVVIAREDRGLLRLAVSSNSPSVAKIETINTNL